MKVKNVTLPAYKKVKFIDLSVGEAFERPGYPGELYIKVPRLTEAGRTAVYNSVDLNDGYFGNLGLDEEVYAVVETVTFSRVPEDVKKRKNDLRVLGCSDDEEDNDESAREDNDEDEPTSVLKEFH